MKKCVICDAELSIIDDIWMCKSCRIMFCKRDLNEYYLICGRVDSLLNINSEYLHDIEQRRINRISIDKAEEELATDCGKYNSLKIELSMYKNGIGDLDIYQSKMYQLYELYEKIINSKLLKKNS